MTDDKWRGENRTETMRLYMRKKREERKRLGLCVVCGNHATPPNSRCENCQEYQRRYFQERRKK